MFENKKPDLAQPGVGQNMLGEAPSAPPVPSEVTSSYPAPVIDPKAELAKFMTHSASPILPTEHASLPPASSLGTGHPTITLPQGIIDFDAARKLRGGSPAEGLPDSARVVDRQIDIQKRKAA